MGRPMVAHAPTLSPGLGASVGHGAPFMLALDAPTVEAIARRTAELLREQSLPEPAAARIDAAAVAVMLGTSRQWGYANAEAVGGQPGGPRRRPRLRFDRETVRAWGAC